MANKVTQFLTDKLLLVWRGVVKENPTFVLVLGMCPTLGTTTSAENGFGMGVATMAVLIMSNIVISLIKNVIPDKVRIPAFIVVIASFVTVIQMLMQAFVPSLYASLGVFIPLIVVNCIILGRAEAFAAKNGIGASALDGIFQGIGYTIVLVIMCVIREFLGSGSFGGGLLDPVKGLCLDGTGAGIQIFPSEFGASILTLPFGGFLTLGVLIAATQYLLRKSEEKKAKKEAVK